MLAQEGTVACATAAVIPESFFALEVRAAGLSVDCRAVDPFAWPLALLGGLMTCGVA